MKKINYPPHVQVEVTSECNHNCIHCYNYWRRDKPVRKEKIAHSEQYYLKIADKIIEQKANTVVITGGEPFLVFEKVIPAIDRLIDNGIKVSINTNAVLVNDNIIDYLLKRGIRLFISFPSSNPDICDKITNIKGSRDRIIKSLDLLHYKGVRFTLNIVVSKINIDNVEESVKFLKSRYDINKVFITRVGKPVNSDDSFDKYLLDRDDIKRLQEVSVKLYKELGINVEASCPYTPCSIVSQEAFDLFGYKKMCSAGKTTYAIGFDGSVKACPRDGKSYGNIFDDDFKDIWNDMEEWRDDSLLPKECKNCSEKSFCFGGCRVDTYPITGRMDTPDSIADFSNIPLKFKCNRKAEEIFKNEDLFMILNGLEFVQEDFGYRVSRSERYLYITNEFKEFLDNNFVISFEDLKRTFNLSTQEANIVINRLIFYNIILKT